MESQAIGKQKTTLRPSKSQGIDYDDKPLWNHVKVLSTAASGGGNRVWSCNYCNKKVTGSYYKVKAHLLKLPNHGVEACKSMSIEVAAIIRKEHEQAEKKKEKSELLARKQSSYLSLPQGLDLLQQKKRKTGDLEKAFNVAERDMADKLVARMFYASPLPFNLIRNPFFRKLVKLLGNSRLAGYCPPTYDRLRTTLLAQEKTHINLKLQPIRECWGKKGVSICSDGWTDIQRRPLINIMAASDGGAVFISSTNASGHVKDAEYVANVFIKAIEEVGSNNVVQVVTDNASNYKAAGAIIEQKYSRIFWTPCVVHSLNLALKRMCEPPENSDEFVQCKWISQLICDVQNIRNFIVNHDMANAIFSNYSNLSLLKVAETRFASGIIMVEGLMKVKKALEEMVMDDKWKTYRGDGKTLVETKAREIKHCIVDDNWWDNLDYLLKLTKPIIDFIRAADTDSPMLHLVYDMWDSMIEKVKAIVFEHEGNATLSGDSEFFNAIHSILVARWTKSNTPLHCLAHSLVPKYYSDYWLQDGNGLPRVAPNEDQEISMNRIKCFKKLFPNPEDFKQVSLEFGAFSSGTGYFGDAHVMDARNYEEPMSWWANHGSTTKLLRVLALKLLSQPASSSCCERNWSTYSLIQNVKRNKLTSARAEDLVYVHANTRLLSRKKPWYKEGPSKYWDICGDNVDIDGDENVLANFSINEPKLEGAIFDDEE